MIQRDLEHKKRTSTAFSPKTIQEGLKDIFRHLGYDLMTLSVDDKEVVADKLSRIANQTPPWGWRYVHNVLTGKLEASERFGVAIVNTLATIDGAHPLLAGTHPVTIRATGKVKPGTVVFGDGVTCANPACPIEFIPRVWNQTSCSPECGKAARKAKRQAGH